MRQFRVVKLRPSSRSNVPKRSPLNRRNDQIRTLSFKEFKAHKDIKCYHYLKNDYFYYYDHKISISYTEYLRLQRKCDRTFSLDEFRKVGQLKEDELNKRR